MEDDAISDGGDNCDCDSEGDFVDVTELENWKNNAKHPPNKLGLPVHRSVTMRSSMKSPIYRAKEDEKIKRTISFNLQTEKAHVEIQPSKDEKLRQLFTSSCIPPSGQRETRDKRLSSVESQEPDCVADNADSVPDRVRWKSKSLGRNDAKKVAPDLTTKRRHSDSTTNRPVLRDSAIDLISDDDHSDAYTAVSLAGTLKRGAPPLHTDNNRRKYVIIGLVCVAIVVIIVLSILLAKK